MLSSKDTAQTVTVTSRASQRTSDKPVYHYNNCIKGVDLADQYTVYYSFIRKSQEMVEKVLFKRGN